MSVYPSLKHYLAHLSAADRHCAANLGRDPARARREIPVLAMLESDEGDLQARAQRLCAELGSAVELVRSTAKVGGGALPLLELEGPAVAICTGTDPVVLARALRAGDPPVIGRIHDGRVLLDPRTLTDADVGLVIAAVRAALGSR